MMAWQLAAKTTRDSLFLGAFPATALPPAVGAAAVCSIVVALLSTKLLHRFGPYKLIPAGFLLGAVLHVGSGPFSAAIREEWLPSYISTSWRLVR